MDKTQPSRLRFNFGFLLEAEHGTSRTTELEYPSIRVADDLTLIPLRGAFTATRVSEGVYLTGALHSHTRLGCVRCLEDANVAITIRLDDLFYYPAHSAPPGEHTIGENGYVDLAPLVRELAWLDVPIQPLCKDDCQGLCMICGTNLNDADCDCVDDEIDPRLEVLKQLLN